MVEQIVRPPTLDLTIPNIVIYMNLLRMSKDTPYLKNLVFALKHQLQQLDLSGIEPHPALDGLTPEILQEALKNHVQNCARKTGIERALAVRQGIEKVFYSKDTITVRFILARPPDGKSLLNQRPTSGVSHTPPAFVPSAQKTEKPASGLETGSSLWLGSEKMVELKGIEPSTSSLRTTRSPS